MSSTTLRLLAAGACIAALVTAPASASANRGPTGTAAVPHCGAAVCSKAQLRARILRLRTRVVRLRDERGAWTVRLRTARLRGGVAALAAERTYWLRRRKAVRRARPLWKTLERWEAWMCIHRHEGAWNDPDSPYWGGLQMNRGFMRTYGAEFLRRYGTADRWPPAVQVAVAERAHRTRGFGPWPNTARRCGLL